jgi:large subunit ribosomal protein L25
VPGVLYGGPRGPVPIAVDAIPFKKALYTGKLLGHLVKLQHGAETQSVIAKDVQFHPSPTPRCTSTCTGWTSTS